MESIKKVVEKEAKVVHKNSKCSKCGKSPIEGIRYICMQCLTFQLCQSCENKFGKQHGHQLLKLRRADDFDKFKNYIFKPKDLEKLNKIEENEEEIRTNITKCKSTITNLKEIYTTLNNNNFIPIDLFLRNNGDEQWPSPCFFTCDEERSKIIGERVKISNFSGLPGEQCKIKIKINLKNIKKTGTYTSVWQLKNENGEEFGEKFIFNVNDIFEKKTKEKEKKTEVKDYRDELENKVNEIKQKYDILFTTASIRNALIRTKGNKQNAIKILFTEQKKNN
jgi:hypothetical protein